MSAICKMADIGHLTVGKNVKVVLFSAPYYKLTAIDGGYCLHYGQWKKRPYFTTHGLFMGILERESVPKEAGTCSSAHGPQVKLCHALSEDLC
jgi:hypothetical protein